MARGLLLRGVVEALFSGNNYLTAKKLLDASALRQEALAANIANVETPGYKRVDVDKTFEAELTQAARKGDLKSLKETNPTLIQDPNAAAVRPDGNNVSMDRELMEVNRNTVEYQFLTQYLSSSLDQIKTAISSRPE